MITSHTETLVAGFGIHTLANAAVEFSLAPALGARVVSVRDLTTGREWLDGWSPASERRIWQPSDPADFATGPGAGLDECLPTVLPCTVGSSKLADHGELWNRPAAFGVDPAEGSVACHWALESLPLAFFRRITLAENRLRFYYRIENLATDPTPFQWAWHPLLTFVEGDELRFTPPQTTCHDPTGELLPWPASQPGCDLSRAFFSDGSAKCAKVFLGPLAAAQVRIETLSGASLDLEWPTEWLPYAGIWITRGAWKGLHHWAVEPSNVPTDSLADAIQRPELARFAFLQPGEIRTWHVTLTLGSQHGVAL